MHWDDTSRVIECEALPLKVRTLGTYPIVPGGDELSGLCFAADLRDPNLLVPVKRRFRMSPDGLCARKCDAPVATNGVDRLPNVAGRVQGVLPDSQTFSDDPADALRRRIRDALELAKVPAVKELQLISVDRLIERLLYRLR
tara:strand:+ start:1730 stop:2155 length:426 start_codon:yes stop_codon:yes gene_type:complete